MGPVQTWWWGLCCLVGPGDSVSVWGVRVGARCWRGVPGMSVWRDLGESLLVVPGPAQPRLPGGVGRC